ncbi:unnamed protein product [Rotaria sp. Silwood1]|nr:unnamed protein product [Rotaria sp. Silwood1]CAF1441838.1 unnamed protein product [Rotaria sp. Silwood1]
MLCSIFFKSELTDLGVCVKNARKNYGHWWKSITVLRDINITVPTGIIYGLLGKRPGSHGHEVPGRSVGYMPQETALYKNFSISEMLHHFGRLHNMSRKDILAREEFLISFLDLPSRSRNVSQLSGGQQRRVSLTCALLQQPQLLILDEPTVGVDPLLREKIWRHLINISKTNKTTIIITAHYIEEAGKADRVGLMRSGKMLPEHEPSSILNKYNQTSLKNVFLQLCYQDQNRIQQHVSMNRIDDDKDTDIPNEIDNEEEPSISLDVSNCSNEQELLIPKKQKRKFEKNRNAEHIPMALYNSEAVNGFPTGYLSLQIINKLNPDQIHLIC